MSASPRSIIESKQGRHCSVPDIERTGSVAGRPQSLQGSSKSSVARARTSRSSTPSSETWCGSGTPACPDGYTCMADGSSGRMVCVTPTGQVPDAINMCANDSNLEPNDTKDNAYATPVDGVTRMTIPYAGLAICPAGDKDWFGIASNILLIIGGFNNVTLIRFEAPKRDELAVSVAVTVWFPTVLNTTGKFPMPFVSFESDGSVAAESVLLKCAVPG